MNPIGTAAVLSVLTLVTQRPTSSGDAWETLYQTRSNQQWLSAVWSKSDGSWFAAGKDFIVSSDTQKELVSDIGSFVVYAFGEDDSGKVTAVGSRQGIWEEQAGRFVQVHSRPGPPLEGRAAYGDVLHGIGYLDPARPDRLVAYASLDLALWRDADGTWRPVVDHRLASRGTLGPELTPPAGCHPSGWYWLSRTDGLLACHEGRGYVYAGSTPTAIGSLPAACQRLMGTVGRDGANLYLVCGATQHIWTRREGTGNWSRVPGISGVRALRSTGGCVVAATRTIVVRRCLK